MIKNEALWFKEILSSLKKDEISPILDIGSGSKHTRKIALPCIDKYIFDPLTKRGITTLHMDLRQEEGVDIIGNINDSNIIEKIAKQNIKSAFCMNFLEHVLNREIVCKNILSLIPPNGYLFVSCPYVFPKHLDPIDTMFRPNIEELKKLFPGTSLIKGEIINCGNFFSLFEEKPFSIIPFLLSLLFPIDINKWQSKIALLSYIQKKFMVTCIVLQKR